MAPSLPGLSERNTLLVGAAVVGVPSTLWLLSKARRAGAAGPAPTDFEAYLRQSDAPATSDVCPTSFEAYLRAAAQPATEQAAAAGAAASGAAAVPLDRAPVTVLFGTEYGFSKEIAEKLAERMKEAGQLWPRVLDMADYPEGLPLERCQALLMVCSTQGDGVPPGEAREFCDWLQSGAAPQLAGVPFSVCALGDRSYQHYCRCGKQLDSRLETLGGSRLHERADINREDWKAVNAWMDGVLSVLPTLGLKTAEELGEDGASAEEGGHTSRKWGKSRPYLGTITAIEGLCNITSKDDKNTFRVEIDLGDSGLQYAPGDALGVWPHNCPQGVDELLAGMGADPGLLIQVPSWHYADPEKEGRTTMSLRDALTKCYDLRSPKPDLLHMLHAKLAAKQESLPKPPALTNGSAAGGGKKGGKAAGSRRSSDAGSKENGHAAHAEANGKAAAVANGSHQALCADGCIVDKLERLSTLVVDESAAERYLEPRHVTDVLSDFSPAKLGVGELLGLLRPLQPRLYSISSSQREGERSVQATVAVVRYESLGKDRIGVASTYLGERLEVGQQLPVYIHKNPDFRLPANPSTPIIMVGPGTGLAPFRSFMQERLLAAQQDGAVLGPAVLYFGCRRRDQDYLYGSLLEGWAAEGKLQLFTAFSREQAHKVYVQNRLSESGELVWGLLQQGGHFYVCGDAAHMAGQVEEALLQIIQQQGARSSEAAQQYLDSLAAEGRYQRDVWF